MNPFAINDELLVIEEVDLARLSEGKPNAEMLEHAQLRNEIYAWDYESDVHEAPAEDVQSYLAPTKYRDMIGYHIRYDGHLIGRAFLELPLEEDSKIAYIGIEILPEYRGQGVGSRILKRLEQEAIAAGRSVLEVWSTHRNSAAEPHVSSLGIGSVPKDISTVFLINRGYQLGQVERMSVYDYRVSEHLLEPLRSQCLIQASSDYEYLSWSVPIPEEFIQYFAAMKQQMSLDAPVGDVEMDEEHWDAERVKAHDSHLLKHGRTRLTGAIRHKSSGALVAYTELEIGTVPTAVSTQQDTFVLKTHRGHSLGMWVKTETMQRWRAQHPESHRIVTCNAEENSYKLRVNVEMGFVPASYEGAWKKSV